MTFFSSFFGVCRGLAAFKKVKDNSVFKTTVHLLLVLIFCSLAIGVGSYFILKNYYWKYTKIDFEENFGAGIQFTDRGVLPEKNAVVATQAMHTDVQAVIDTVWENILPQL